MYFCDVTCNLCTKHRECVSRGLGIQLVMSLNFWGFSTSLKFCLLWLVSYKVNCVYTDDANVRVAWPYDFNDNGGNCCWRVARPD